MNKIASYVSSRGFRDGLVRGKGLWTFLGAVVWLARLIMKMGSRRERIVAREILEPGQSITISSLERDAE